MDSPYLIFGLLILLTGFFLAVAISIQFCACMKAFRRIRRNKARLREIQEAAAQPPPPYAVVVSSCHLNSSSSDYHLHQSPSPNVGNNVCCIIGTILPHQGSPIISSPSSNIMPMSNLRCTRPVCYSCSQNESSDFQPHFKASDSEHPPSYEDAVRNENER